MGWMIDRVTSNHEVARLAVGIVMRHNDLSAAYGPYSAEKDVSAVPKSASAICPSRIDSSRILIIGIYVNLDTNRTRYEGTNKGSHMVSTTQLFFIGKVGKIKAVCLNMLVLGLLAHAPPTLRTTTPSLVYHPGCLLYPFHTKDLTFSRCFFSMTSHGQAGTYFSTASLRVIVNLAVIEPHVPRVFARDHLPYRPLPTLVLPKDRLAQLPILILSI